MAPQKRGNFLQFLLIFVALYLGMQLVLGIFFPKQEGTQQVTPGPVLTSSHSFTIGNHPVVTIQNRPATEQSFGIGGWVQSKWCSVTRVFGAEKTPEECEKLAVIYTGTPYELPNRCPQPPVDVFAVGGTQTASGPAKPLVASGTVIPCLPMAPLPPGHTTTISMGPWKYSLFEREGTFEVRLPGTAASDTTSTQFTITEPGFFTKLFRTFISAPFLNFLIFVGGITPGHNLGIAIIILTLVVKLLLFIPTQHALEGQKKMQMLQPKIEALRARYKDDQKTLQEETMKLWKEHKINPFQSCLPLLIQFPILIGLFYVIRDSADLTLSQHLIYGFNQNLSWHFGMSFLGLNLLQPDVIVMPILLVVLQFLQMKLSFSIQKRKKAKQDVIDVGDKEKSAASPEAMQQKMMLYGLPLMIGIFALRFPSAVAVYWGVSTLFAIGQQMIVNREHLRV
jgi:YidC/Oxa1 family membrane protein insertase